MIPAPIERSITIRDACDRVIYDEIFVNGEYAPALELLWRQRRSPAQPGPAVIVDLGLNIGYFTSWIAAKLEDQSIDYRIYGFEAARENFTEACKQILGFEPSVGLAIAPVEPDCFRSHDGRILLTHGAVGARVGACTICLSGSHPCHRVESSPYEEIPAIETADMEYTDIEEYLPPTPIALLKCDIEGSELRFIESYFALLLRTQILAIELHHEYCDTVRCVELLGQVGLSPAVVTRGTLNSKRGACTAVFSRKDGPK